MPNAGALVKAYNNVEQDTVTTFETSTNTSYIDLATPGPTVVVHLDAGQSCLIIAEALLAIDAGTNGAMFSVEVAGPSTSDLTAADDNGVEYGGQEWTPGTKHTLFTATAAGDHTTKIKYKRLGATGTAQYKQRRLTVIVLP